MVAGWGGGGIAMHAFPFAASFWPWAMGVLGIWCGAVVARRLFAPTLCVSPIRSTLGALAGFAISYAALFVIGVFIAAAAVHLERPGEVVLVLAVTLIQTGFGALLGITEAPTRSVGTP